MDNFFKKILEIKTKKLKRKSCNTKISIKIYFRDFIKLPICIR